MRGRLHPTVRLLAAIHFLVDGYGNMYAPLLPLLVPQLGLSLATVGTLQMSFQISNSVAQLGFGAVADRWNPRALLVAGPLVAVSAITLIGPAPTVLALAAALILGGLGGAAFHPPAAALVHRFGGPGSAYAMAFHISAGALGQAAAPLVFAPFAARWGLAATPLLMLPPLVAFAFMLRALPSITRLQEQHEVQGFAALKPYRKPLTLLYLIVVLRTLTSLSFGTFMTVMLTRQGLSVAAAGGAAAAYLFATSVGGFFGGPLADRWGPRRLIMVSLVSAVPFLAAAPFFTGWTFVGIVAIGGFLLQSSLPVNVTFGQTIAPISAATVSSLMMGFAWGSGGLVVPLVGLLADRIGIEHTLVTMAFVPLFASALAFPLPGGRVQRSARHAASVTSPETAGTDVAE